MNIAELKLELITQIIETNDRELLLKINTLLIEKQNNTLLFNEPATAYQKMRIFSEDEQQKINLALKQVENGEYISDEEAQIEIEKWFEEQEK